jgi:hyperosmotically inducible periplasmic protein
MELKRKAITGAVLAALTLGGLAACQSDPNQQSTGEYLDDATVTARVKTALIQAPDVKAHQINVETHNGVVQLSGFVDSEDEARRAIDAADDIPGVKKVENDMRVKPGG